jgi:hypothetical protein
VQNHMDDCIFNKLKGYIEMNEERLSELRVIIEVQ